MQEDEGGGRTHRTGLCELGRGVYGDSSRTSGMAGQAARREAENRARRGHGWRAQREMILVEPSSNVQAKLLCSVLCAVGVGTSEISGADQWRFVIDPLTDS